MHISLFLALVLFLFSANHVNCRSCLPVFWCWCWFVRAIEEKATASKGITTATEYCTNANAFVGDVFASQLSGLPWRPPKPS